MNTSDFTIREIHDHKKRFLELLLTGDESEEMIDRYLDRGRLLAGFLGNRPIAVCVVTEEGCGMAEVKNLAVSPDCRRKGFGRTMLKHIDSLYPDCVIRIGTGETPSTLRFYESCGYVYSHRIPDFFKDNYPAPIVEEGVELCDMVYLAKPPSDIRTQG